MHRKASASGSSPLSDPPAIYEKREIDPNAEETVRRLGSARQAQYAQALGLVSGPKGSFIAYDTELNLGSTWSVGFSLNVGDVAEDTGEWTVLFGGSTATTDLANSFRVYLKRNGADYQVNLTYVDTGSAVTESVTPITVTPGSNVNILVTKSGTAARLNVGGSLSTMTLAGTYALTTSQVQILGTHKVTTRPKGTPPVLDNLQVWGSVVTTAEYADRTPTGSPILSVLPAEIGGYIFEPATSAAPLILHPAPPQLLDSKLYFSGYGGAVRVPFRSVFQRYFQTSTEGASTKKFAFRVKGQRKFLTSTERTLIDFGSDTEGFCYLTTGATAGKPKFTYNGTTITYSGTAIAEDADFSIIVGCDGTDLYMQVDGNEQTATAPAAPYLDYERIPDLYIGNDEDPADELGFHGYLTAVEFYDYAFREDTTTTAAPAFALDVAGDYLRDKSRNRLPVESISHATTEGRPYYAPGPLTDQSFVGVESEIVFGPGALDYDGTYKAPLASGLAGVRAGDRAFIHSGDHVHVFNSELSQVRPLGLPIPEADVSVQAVGTGALDGAYDYGYRWVSQDGTFGPLKRLKPVKATGQASVLVGAGDADGEEERRELGESYGLAPSGSASWFTLTDTADGVAASGTTGHTVESYLRFPDFDDLEEVVSDRGSKGGFTDKSTMCAEPDTPIDIDPNSDFCLQVAFRCSTAQTSSETHKHQGLLAIGHEDPGPTTRSVMAYLDIGSTFSTGTIRLVVARSLGLKDSRYRYLIFNSAADEGDDTGLWVSGRDYSLTLVRDGEDLRVHVYDKTNTTWHDFEGGACVGFFSGYDFPHKNIDFRASNVAFRKTGSSGNHWEGIADLPTAGSGTNYTDAAGSTGTHGYRDYGTGASNRGANRLGWMDRAGYLYHARAWSRAWPKATVHFESLKRFVATAGEPMSDRIKSDVGFFNEDPAINPSKFFDKAANQFWRVYKADTSDTGLKNPTKGICAQVAGTPTEFDGVVITDTGVAGLGQTHYRVFASSLGDGSLVFTTNEASYILATKQWDDTASASYVKPLSDVKIDPQAFNWFTTTVAFITNSGDFDVSILDLDINGNRIFDAALGSYSTPLERGTEDLIVYLGGFAGSNNGNTHIGEFRLWSKNRYDDASETYDFLTGRVRNSERSDLYFYATFEPADEVTASTYTQHGSLSSELLTLVASASVVDTRASNGSGGATDPAPAIGIPAPPYDYITAVELFRTQGYPINDPQDEGEVQAALAAVRGNPLYRLARLPAGDPSYVDISPDDGLGFSEQEGTGFLPERPNGVGIWQNQLFVWRDNDLHFSEPGPYGWDSYPTWLRYPVPSPKSGSDIVAAAEVQDALLVCGKSWATLLTNAPSNPRALDLGSGAGVQSACALATHGGLAFGLGKGKLWVLQQGQIDDSFGLPVQDLLPAAGCLAVSGDLSSLLVIDTASDLVLRFHFPTKAWSVEERDATAAGDVDGTVTWTHTSGAYSTASTTIYGDDVTALTSSTASGTVATTSTINMSGTPNAPVGSRVLVIDENGNEVLTRVVSYA
jgi:hypothetical protein